MRFTASAGIGVLMGACRVLANEDGSLVLVRPTETSQALSMTGVSKPIPVAASVADAVARLNS